MSNKSLVILLIVVLVLLGAFGVYYLTAKKTPTVSNSTSTSNTTETQTPTTQSLDSGASSTPTNATSSNSSSMNNVTELQITTTKEGTGTGAKAGDNVTVDYTGTLTNGTKFDSSLDRGQPFTFQLGTGAVIQGWDQGLLGMKVGEKRHLVIPASMGYGSVDYGPIPANSVLIFDVEMKKIN